MQGSQVPIIRIFLMWWIYYFSQSHVICMSINKAVTLGRCLKMSKRFYSQYSVCAYSLEIPHKTQFIIFYFV